MRNALVPRRHNRGSHDSRRLVAERKPASWLYESAAEVPEQEKMQTTGQGSRAGGVLHVFQFPCQHTSPLSGHRCGVPSRHATPWLAMRQAAAAFRLPSVRKKIWKEA